MQRTAPADSTLSNRPTLMGKTFFAILAVFAEFEVDLVTMRIRAGSAAARTQGDPKGKKPLTEAR